MSGFSSLVLELLVNSQEATWALRRCLNNGTIDHHIEFLEKRCI